MLAGVGSVSLPSGPIQRGRISRMSTSLQFPPTRVSTGLTDGGPVTLAPITDGPLVSLITVVAFM